MVNRFRNRTFLNWTANGQQMDSKWTTNGQQVDTNKKDKEYKEREERKEKESVSCANLNKSLKLVFGK